MLRKIRITLAAIFFIALSLCFLDFTGTIRAYFDWMAKIQLIPAILALNFAVVFFLIALSAIFGRVYCSIICPLGVLQDVFSFIHNRQKKARIRFSFSKEKPILRYVMLVLFIILLFLGPASIAGIIAPYSAFGRIMSSIFAPIYAAINNVLAGIAEQHQSYAFYTIDVWMKGSFTLGVAIVTLIVLFVLAWRNGRTYCNTICPIGTFLSLFARFAVLRPVIDSSKCNGCTLCSRKCKASCIDAKNHKIDYSRCVACMDCISNCNQGAISYRNAYSHKTAPATDNIPQNATNSNRRSFLTLASLLTVGSAIKAQESKVDGGLAVIEDKKIPSRKCRISPPGSVSLKNLTNHCTACQLCIQACPNGVLRPSTKLENLMQPEMSFERGYCRPECNKCSQVCPTGAIKPIGLDVKTATQIGHAVWVAENCIINTDKVKCGNCARHCPNGAIKMMPIDENNPESPWFPVIDAERCIGCGACEYVCPARPFSAIYVEGISRHRDV